MDFETCTIINLFYKIRRIKQIEVVWKTDSMRIFGPKRDELTGSWRKLHKHDLYDHDLVTKY
jgi:hypothetical protein